MVLQCTIIEGLVTFHGFVDQNIVYIAFVVDLNTIKPKVVLSDYNDSLKKVSI